MVWMLHMWGVLLAEQSLAARNHPHHCKAGRAHARENCETWAVKGKGLPGAWVERSYANSNGVGDHRATRPRPHQPPRGSAVLDESALCAAGSDPTLPRKKHQAHLHGGGERGVLGGLVEEVHAVAQRAQRARYARESVVAAGAARAAGLVGR